MPPPFFILTTKLCARGGVGLLRRHDGPEDDLALWNILVPARRLLRAPN